MKNEQQQLIDIDQELQLMEHDFSQAIADRALPHTGYQVLTEKGEWHIATQELWRSWLGDRMIWGHPYHGPVFKLGTDTVYTGRRLCGCSECQSTVNSEERNN